ncbi:MAG TPA: hypothetical protein PK765_07845 [bacterium]|nr:hypothetical protein [bacterium]
MLLFDESTIASNPIADMHKAKLVSNSTTNEPSRLITVPETCSPGLAKELRFSSGSAYYGTVPSWPTPLNTKVYPVQPYCETIYKQNGVSQGIVYSVPAGQ